jgi:hypothetical protein
MLFIAGGLLASSSRIRCGDAVAWGAGRHRHRPRYAPSIGSVPPWSCAGAFARESRAPGSASHARGPLLAASAIAALGWRHAPGSPPAVVSHRSTLLLRRAAACGAGCGASECRSAKRCAAVFWWMYAACVLAAPAIPSRSRVSARRATSASAMRARSGWSASRHRQHRRPLATAGRRRLGRIASIACSRRRSAPATCSLGAGGYFALVVFALWLGLSYGGIVSLMPAVCMDLFGARAVASILGTLYSGAAFGNLLGPVVAGAVFDRTGSYVPVIWACFVLSLLSAAASAQLLRDRRPTY